MLGSAVAIVGRACLLPCAAGPDELWEVVAAARDATSDAPDDRWDVGRRAPVGPPARASEPANAYRGGYVTGFHDRFDPAGLATTTVPLDGLDDHVLWVLHVAREALRDAGHQLAPTATGAIFGNLSTPTASFARLAGAAWLDERGGAGAAERLGLHPPQAITRFVSGLPAQVLAHALQLERGAFALDAACASSLYAIRLACDRLASGAANAMLAGAVCCADHMLMHEGFDALMARSRSGRSRPFAEDADGLLPAEGCGFVLLKRLQDAERDGDRIHGVIRGVGLSNDGRGTSLLAPSQPGQEAALRQAYARSGVSAADISYVECHATGTLLGDAVELATIRSVFGDDSGMAIGSLKANLGHLMTAAGIAGLIKVLEALRREQLPPHPPVGVVMDDVARAGLRLLAEPAPWDRSRGPRAAAVSAFGFGGNNAHLVIEEHARRSTAIAVPAVPLEPVAIVGIGIRLGELSSRAEVLEALVSGAETGRAAKPVVLPLDGLAFPPLDLEVTLGQQTMALACAFEAIDETASLAQDRTAVLIGIEADPDAARFGAGLRISKLADQHQEEYPWLSSTRAALGTLSAAAALGALPNMPANRISRQFDLRGPSFTISSGECSGLDAIDVGVDALRRHEVDAALAGAVDLSAHPVHEQAVRALGANDLLPAGDGAVVLVLKRLEDAVAAGDRIYATIGSDTCDAELCLGNGPGCEALTSRFGHAFAAFGALHLAVAALCVHHRIRPSGIPWLSATSRRALVVAGDRRLALDEVATALREPEAPGLRMSSFAADEAAELLERIERGSTARDGRMRAVLVSGSEDELTQRRRRACDHLRRGTPAGTGVRVSRGRVAGDVAFVFTAASASYRGMGASLLRGLPELADGLEPELRGLVSEALDLETDEPSTVSRMLWGAAALSQLHTTLTRDLLGIKPRALLGCSSGETSTLFAGGAWTDFPALYRDLNDSGIMERELGGRFAALERRWGAPASWRCVGVRAALDLVRAAVDREDRAHLAIINSPVHSVIAGEASAIARAVKTIGADRCAEIDYQLVCHVPEVNEVAAEWQAIHTRDVTPTPGMRYYANAICGTYDPSRDLTGRLLLGQAVGTVDFAATVRAAYHDGARIFVEHGPQNVCARFIAETLVDCDHLVVSLDRRSAGIEAVVDAVAALAAAGVDLDLAWLARRIGSSRRVRAGAMVEVPARWAPSTAAVVRAPPASQQPRAPTTAHAYADEHTLAEGRSAAPASPVPGVAVPAAAQAVTPRPAQAFSALSRMHVDVVERLIGLHARYLDAAAAGRSTATATVVSHRPPRARAIFGRDALLTHATGRISDVFGPAFREQDGFRRQVRMPAPPLLLADRVTDLVGQAGSMGTGRIVTETDVLADAWYLHRDRMPAGIVSEAGQADLMLISFLGIDFINRGQRVYRLLGCTMTYEAALPRPGDTLRYEITIDTHAQAGDTRLFFFHYDCTVNGRPQLTVRNAQAGFFSDEQLAASEGVLWSADEFEPCADARLDSPAVRCTRSVFDGEQIRAFADGDPYACFGPGYEATIGHARSPGVQSLGRTFLDRVTSFDPEGGPWGRGYLSSEVEISPEEWFFAGHFIEDPVMPGNLVFEAGLQNMAFYMAALGFTCNRDRWRFQPVIGEPFEMRCRGQIDPTTRMVASELFVEEVISGPLPTLYADIVATADGVKAFHGRRIGLQLVPE